MILSQWKFFYVVIKMMYMRGKENLSLIIYENIIWHNSLYRSQIEPQAHIRS